MEVNVVAGVGRLELEGNGSDEVIVSRPPAIVICPDCAVVPEVVPPELVAVFVPLGVEFGLCLLDLLVVAVITGNAFTDAWPAFVVWEVTDKSPPAIVKCCDCGVVDLLVLML